MTKPTITTADRLMSIRATLREMLPVGFNTPAERKLLAELNISIAEVMMVRSINDNGEPDGNIITLAEALGDESEFDAVLAQFSVNEIAMVGGGAAPLVRIERAN